MASTTKSMSGRSNTRKNRPHEKTNPPGSLADTPKEERRYREGFDHGIVAVQRVRDRLDEEGIQYDLSEVLDVVKEVSYSFRDDGEVHNFYMQEVVDRALDRLK